MDANYETKDAAFYTPSEPGVSYITATSRDGLYSIRYAVVCEGVMAQKLEPDVKSMTLEAGQTGALNVTLTPEPTLEEDRELIFTSYNKEVATVNENGVITANAPGYAYIKIALATNTNVTSYCVVQVTAPETVSLSGAVTSYGDEQEPVTLQLWQGEELVLSNTTAEDTYELSGILPGAYTLEVSKLNHVTRCYEVTVEAENLTQDVTVCLLGDVTGDGNVNILDIARLYAHVKGDLLTDDYAMACGDVTEDGSLNIIDVGRLYAHIRNTQPLY